MTYNDIKLATLQKMFHNVTTTERTLSTEPYLDKMDFVCNCAINRITSAGFGKKKYAQIISVVPVNLLGSSSELYDITQINGEKIYYAPMGKSYFFELCGFGTAKIYIDSNLVRTIQNDTSDVFKKYKGILENDENKTIRIEFSGDNVFLLKNIAVYNEVYASVDEVYEISKTKSFDMSTIVSDFYKFDSENSVVCESKNNIFSFSEDQIFSVDGRASGVWQVPYVAYPQIITSETNPEEELTISESLCSIIPYYIASELYLEDDSGLCVGWRNKFEAELQELMISRLNKPKNKIKFVSLAGDINEKL